MSDRATYAGSSPSVELPTYKPIAEQPKGFDLFRIPGLRRFVRWKYARLVFQLPLLILALFVIVDGFTGRQLAPRNVATTAVWLHYRGLVVLALALVGNAFCAACPLMLTRGATRRLERLVPKLEFPRFLKNKFLVLVLTFVYLFSYEYFDLWASPWLTAWLAVGYFGAALVVDTLFKAGTFCRYVCPLGNFNFVFSSASPTQITAINHDVCRSCEHKPCLQGRYTSKEEGGQGSRGAEEKEPKSFSPSPPLPLSPSPYPSQTNGNKPAAFIPLSEITHANGSGFFPGCETELFVPTIQSNMDCTNCFNCVRACPYDNVAFTYHAPGWEWTKAPWARRGRFALALFGVLLTFWGLLNAVAMTSPFFGVAQTLAAAFGENEFVFLMTFFGLTTIFGFAVTAGVSYLADLLGQGHAEFKTSFLRWSYVSVALGFGFWGAHYLFHFLTGTLQIIPVFQHFFAFRDFPVDPNWRLSQVVPNRWLFPIEAVVTGIYTFLASYTAIRIALRDFGKRGVLAMWPVLLFVLVFAVFSLWVLGQPMEMRGTVFFSP